MAVVNLRGSWSAGWQKEYNLKFPFFVIKMDNSYIADARVQFKKLDDFQKKKNELRPIDIKIDIHYQKRTLDQNALMWALYRVEANEQNGNMAGHESQMITTEQLYEGDVKLYSPKFVIRIPKDNYSLLLRIYNRCTTIEKDNETLFVEITLGSSRLDTMQMAKWIERQFNRLAYNGLSFDNAIEIKKYWQDWRRHLNEKEIILNKEILTQKEYKKRNPICEASGCYIVGVGELAHIKSIGMGGNPEPEKNYASNWLHLRTDIHRELWHGKGVEEFLKTYPHLSWKVRGALRNDYDVIEKEQPELDIF